MDIKPGDKMIVQSINGNARRYDIVDVDENEQIIMFVLADMCFRGPFVMDFNEYKLCTSYTSSFAKRWVEKNAHDILFNDDSENFITNIFINGDKMPSNFQLTPRMFRINCEELSKAENDIYLDTCFSLLSLGMYEKYKHYLTPFYDAWWLTNCISKSEVLVVNKEGEAQKVYKFFNQNNPLKTKKEAQEFYYRPIFCCEYKYL